jgi:hypothetical protein
MTVTEQEQAPAAGVRRRRVLVPAAVVVAVVAVLASVAAVWLRHGTDVAPYDDPSATGRLTLCDPQGHPVTSGSVEAQPLAATVVGATSANVGDGVVATLYAYQPREGTGPSEWNGIPLTAPGAVADPAHPVLEPGGDSVLLSQFLGGYPAAWDGWVQLRLVVGSADAGAVTSSYDALDLHVDGDRWTAVDPGTASCPS